MFNVIMCDDNKKDLEKIYKITDDYFCSNNFKYKIHKFYDYDVKFEKIIKEKISFKIYILDIETPSGSGIDIARSIRKTDINSAIIFLTGHNELGFELLKEDIPNVAFINKFVNCEVRLKRALNNSIKLLNKRNVLKIIEGSTIYTINFDDILYITKDSYERKTIIVTDYTEIKLKISLKKIYQLLNSNFEQTYRSCIVNNNRVIKKDYKNREILFDNKLTIDLISDKYKKEVVR